MAIELISNGDEIGIKQDKKFKFYPKSDISVTSDDSAFISFWLEGTTDAIATATPNEFTNPVEDSVYDLMLLIKAMLVSDDQFQVEYPTASITTADGSVVQVPMGGSYSCTVKSGIAYHLPALTNQQISFATGDDADNLANGVYDYTPPPYPVSFAQLDTTVANPFLNLVSDNAFGGGNKNRFTDINGLQVYGDDYVIDHYTRLGWYRVYYGNNDKDWATAMSEANALTLLTWSDWRIPNANEMFSIANLESNGSTTSINFALRYSPFNQSQDGVYFWCCTTDSTNNARAYDFLNRLNAAAGTWLQTSSKVLLRNYYVCRNHF